MNRRVFDGTPGSATLLLVAVCVLVVGGGIAWVVTEDGGSERGFSAAVEADAPPPPDAKEPLVAGDEEGPPASDRPRGRGPTQAKRSGRRSGEPSGPGRPADAAQRERRGATKPAPDLQRLLEDAIRGGGGEEPRGRPPARIRNLLEHGLGDGDQESSGGPPPELEDALEELARGG